MSVDLMSCPIFLFLTGTENIFVSFCRVYFCFLSSLSFPTSHSPPLLSKHLEPGRLAEPCPPRESLSCSAALGLSTQELWLDIRDTKINPWLTSISEAGWSQHQEAPPPCKALRVGRRPCALIEVPHLNSSGEKKVKSLC